MYVSQVPTTVLYTVLKTLLLILLTQTIFSICAWMNRYDLAKIFEQGNVTVLIGSITSDRYKKYRGMFFCLFIAICFEVVIGLLPTIATKYMPFQDVLIQYSNLHYFNTNFSIPEQNVSVTSSNDNMDHYCYSMGLCNDKGLYYGNIANISDSMKIQQVEFKNNQYTNEFYNIYIDNNIDNDNINLYLTNKGYNISGVINYKENIKYIKK